MKLLGITSALLTSLSFAGVHVDVQYLSPGQQVSTETNTSLTFSKKGEVLSPMAGVDLEFVKEKNGVVEFSILRYDELKKKDSLLSKATIITKLGQETKIEEKSDKGELLYSLTIHPKKSK